MRYNGDYLAISMIQNLPEEELDQYIEERNRDYGRRKAESATENLPQE